jgi:SOS-response transcriptional repressor LexA
MTGVTAPSLLSSLQDYYARHGVLPSYAAMGELTGIRAKSWVFTLVGQLKEAGFLDVTPENRLKPGPRFLERSLAESVRAGLPEDAPDTPPESISIDRYLIIQPSKTLLVRVKGDSMKDAGILAGDLAVVAWGAAAKIGDIVVAIVDGEFTLKYLERDKRGYFLRAANSDYEPIRPEGELKVSGVMTGLVRRFGAIAKVAPRQRKAKRP